ncbi:MAG: TonB-dependent receptor [Acidobacteria bacterium]|nr:TonB-dependent receptor [Acidobacteriota bacterium]
MKRLVVLILFSFLALAANAASVNGRIIGKGNKKPVAGATVTLFPAGKTVVTKKDGRFYFSNVPGQARIRVQAPGYRTRTLFVPCPAPAELWLVRLSPVFVSESITVDATRAVNRETPVVFTNIDAKQIREEHGAEDIPMLLSGLPNVYSYSDDGSGTGYSYLKVRGFDQSRIGVMINGIPLNDPEDHQVYWVDMPDFAESLNSIQFQRGVGSSLYGVDTFGGSLNLLTKTGSGKSCEFYASGGSYNTWKTGVTAEIPLESKRYHISFRASRLVSDGYRDNSGVRQWAGYLSVARNGDRSITRFVAYTGNEIAHAAWEASPESVLRINHHDNPITYPHTIDNFSQPHYELHHTIILNDNTYWKNTLFYIHGRGYYEQYKHHRNMYDYGLWPTEENAPHADIIRQKWVKKNQYGWVSELGIHHENSDLTVGTYFSSYNSHHWGEVDDVIGLEIPGFQPNFVYHRYFSGKKYATAYINELYHPTGRITLMGNLHYQYMSYGLAQQAVGNFTGSLLNSFRVRYRFWNPRAGINFNLSDTVNLYANISGAHREPADSELYDTWYGPDDLGVTPLFSRSQPIMENRQIIRVRWVDPEVKPEKLLDYEAGIMRTTNRMTLRANLFWMDFHDEIVSYGQVNDDGFPIRGNADKTIHRGIELSGTLKLPGHFQLDVNCSFNDNYFKKFIFHDYDWNTGQSTDVDLSGNTIAGFPDFIANTTISWRTDAVTAAVRWQAFGKQYLDNTENRNRIIPSYNMVNAWISTRLPCPGRLKKLVLNLKFYNIFNKLTYTAGYYDTWAGENYYWPSAGFHFSFGIRATY